MTSRRPGIARDRSLGGVRPLRLLVALGLLATLAVGVRAQRPVTQDGRLLDANPRVGGTRYNITRPVSPLAVGNALAQGTIGRGLSLRNVSPIADPTAFRGRLGSTTLSAFRRDSVSAANTSSPYGGLIATSYFDPTRTVYTGGFLSGQYGSAPSVGPQAIGLGGVAGLSRAPSPLDLRLDTRLNVGPAYDTSPLTASGAALRSQIVGLTPGSAPELSSSIFGPAALAPTGVLTGTGDRLFPNLDRPSRRGTLEGWRTRPGAGLRADEPPGSRPPLGTPAEFVQREERGRLPLDAGQDPFAIGATESPLLLGPPPRQSDVAGRDAGRTDLIGSAKPKPTLRLQDPSVLPGYDLFNDMQLGLALVRDPGASWFSEMQTAIRENSPSSTVLNEFAAMQSREFVAKVLDAPIRTLRGGGESAVNDELLKAESLLEIGQYYEAVRRYDAAHRLDPLNPLPLVGKGNAFLAAGEYLSAATSLARGFERYPELSQFKFDLKSLIGGGEIVDIRRADIMRRLESHDDPRLRFLLGYLEYYSGNQEQGLKNLEEAAELDHSGSIISRLPAMLRREGLLPPPQLPGELSPVPEPERPPSTERKEP